MTDQTSGECLATFAQHIGGNNTCVRCGRLVCEHSSRGGPTSAPLKVPMTVSECLRVLRNSIDGMGHEGKEYVEAADVLEAEIERLRALESVQRSIDRNTAYEADIERLRAAIRDHIDNCGCEEIPDVPGMCGACKVLARALSGETSARSEP